MLSMFISTPNVIEKKAKNEKNRPTIEPPVVSDWKPPPYLTMISSKKTVAS
jgi:hypothetical protein